MSEVIYKGRIDGDFEGFDDGRLFKLANGAYWIQAQYRYWYHYAYGPEVAISQASGHHMLTVAGQSVAVRRIHDVIESQIDGPFEGWQGKSVYRLVNGQVWRQSVYTYEYKYAFRPEALVYEVDGAHRMQVEGIEAQVVRVQ